MGSCDWLSVVSRDVQRQCLGEALSLRVAANHGRPGHLLAFRQQRRNVVLIDLLDRVR